MRQPTPIDSPRTQESLNLAIGHRAGLVVAELCRTRRRGGIASARVLEALTRVLGEHPLPYGSKSAMQATALLAASYLRHFMPPPGWRFLGAELALGSGRVDLGWRSPEHAVLLDELKAGQGLEPALDGEARRQVRGYLGVAREQFPHLAGIRLISLRHAEASLLLEPSGRFRALADTAYWLGGPR